LPQPIPASSIGPSSTDHRQPRRSLQLALVITSLTWFVLSNALAARAARGLSNRFDAEAGRPLLTALFLIFLLIVGFTILQGITQTGTTTLRSTLGLPRRPSAGREWALGAAIGWGLAVCSILPMLLARSLHVRFWTEPRAFGLLLLNVATIAAATIATEIALRGYPFRQLIAAIGPAWATVATAVLLGIVHYFSPDPTWISVLATMVASILFSVAWLRTHGLWLPWGLHFAWNASIAILFGLPVRGVVDFASIIQTRAIGSAWLTGDDFGPEGAFLTALVLLGGIVVLVRTTRDYAWDYTHPQIVPGGYEVEPAPPAAHTAMEKEVAAKSPALVQILPTTPQSRSIDGR